MNHEGKRHEGHEVSRSERFGMRHPPALSAEAEIVMTETIGCDIAVHKALGPGFLESLYKKAMRIELEARGLTYEAEKPVKLTYRGVDLPGQRIDLLVGGLIVVELKAVMRLDQIHVAQVISYLNATKLRGGLLINFRVPYLKVGLRRIVL
jgi:GxxExxY protein